MHAYEPGSSGIKAAAPDPEIAASKTTALHDMTDAEVRPRPSMT